ncbi:MAG: hypothetical protein AAGA96_06575 [Verrucomicrobiota bacterium]
MSEQQKVFASISGAVVAHLLLVVVAFLLVNTASRGSSLRDDSSLEDRSQEITIMLSDLLERLEVEEPEPEPDPIEERPYISTDLNERETESPENARFESDRNTSAASELAPDPTKPQVDLPTLDGDERFRSFELETQKYTDGEVNQPTSMAAVSQDTFTPPPSDLPAAAGFAADRPGEELPNPESKNGEDAENMEGADEAPVEELANQRTRPDGSVEDTVETEETLAKSFVDPNGLSDSPPQRDADGEEDQLAQSSEEVGEIGNRADRAEKQEMAAGQIGNEGEADTDGKSQTQPQLDLTAVADAGIFAQGYSRERLQSRVNGSLSSTGQNAVDAEETAIGRYKKQVHDAIGKVWYRYHAKYRDSATWGVLKLEFRVDKAGKVHGLRVVKNEANSVMVEFSLEAVLDADIPLMPKEVADELGIGGLDLSYDFIIY